MNLTASLTYLTIPRKGYVTSEDIIIQYYSIDNCTTVGLEEYYFVIFDKRTTK